MSHRISHRLPELATKANSRVTGAGTRGRRVGRLWTKREVAEILNASERTVSRRIEDGDLVATRIGHLVRISDEDLAAFIAANRSI